MGRFSAGLATALLCAAGPAGAALPVPDTRAPVELTADELEYDGARDLYEARGSVRVRQGGATVDADWLVFHNGTGRGVATGEVVVRQGGDVLTATFLQFDVYTLEGAVFDGRLDAADSGYAMEGAAILKTGDETYTFEDGAFTTCRCPEGGREPWRFRAERTDLEVGGYGTARNSTFDVLGVPVLWFPWMIFPLKTERQTGLLFPEFRLSKHSGFDVGLPLFWAVSDPLNLTLTPRWLTKSGPKGDVAVEYVVGERSAGNVSGAFLHDREIERDLRNAKLVGGSLPTPFSSNRWNAMGNQDFFLPGGARLKSEFAFVSDNQYVVDFSEARLFNRFRFLESNAFAARGFGASGAGGLVASARFADDLQSPDNKDRDRVLLHRLPNVELSWLPSSLGAVAAPALDVQYTHFRPRERVGKRIMDSPTPRPGFLVRQGFFFDTGVDGIATGFEGAVGDVTDRSMDDATMNPGGSELDGRFQEGEPLADRGHRLLLTPRLGVPLRLGRVAELYPEVGWSQTLWQTDKRGLEQRGGLLGRVDLRSSLRREFAGGWSHRLTPRVGWAILTKRSLPEDPLFVPRTALPQERIRQLHLDNVVLDPADRVGRFHGVTFGFGNRFYRRGSRRRAARLLADVELGGQYGFRDDRFGLLLVDGRAFPLPTTSLRFHAGYDPHKSILREGLAEAGWSHRDGHGVSLSYRYLDKIPEFFERADPTNERFEDFRQLDRVSQLSGAVRVALGERWAASYTATYSTEESLLLASRGAIEYTSGCRCWGFVLGVSADRAGDLRFSFLYRFIGLGRDFAIGTGSLAEAGLLDGD